MLFRALLVLFLVCTSAHAFTESELNREFDPRVLTYDEKRFLQSALAFEGYYTALLDGEWGNGSQRALSRAAINLDVDEPLPNWAVMVIALGNAIRFEEEGWTEQYLEWLDMSVLMPFGQLKSGKESDTFLNYHHDSSSLGYSFSVGTGAEAQYLHNYTFDAARTGTKPYTVRRSDVWITSSRNTQNLTLYTRSDFRRGNWSTIMLSAHDPDAGIIAAVSGSIARGRSREIQLPNGWLSDGVAALLASLDNGKSSSNQSSDPPVDQPRSASAANIPKTPDDDVTTGSGTGFSVTDRGHILTNAHVVDGCDSVKVNRVAAKIVALDAPMDLALLMVPELANEAFATFSGSPAMLNSDITVAGYPLAGMLGGLNVTRGAVTSLTGIQGDSFRMQISAPVQPGNSGGPVVDRNGAVVGVVVSKLDARRVSDAIGDIPQNVNFAIRGEIAKLFLAQHGVQPVTVLDELSLTPEALAKKAQEFTYFVTCE